MARTARKHSDSGVYHVILRGVNKQQIYHKYGRIGHLFQERFKSQPVGDWGYFREYKWSSWLEYIGQEKNAFCATNVVLSRISLEELSNLIAEPLAEKEEDGLLDIEVAPVKTYYSDEEIWHVLTNLCGMTTAAEFQQLPRPQQKHYLWESHEKGIGPRALSRLTGVPYSIVQRATSAENAKRLQSGMVCESTLEDEDLYSYCSPDDFEPYPEY